MLQLEMLDLNSSTSEDIPVVLCFAFRDVSVTLLTGIK